MKPSNIHSSEKEHHLLIRVDADSEIGTGHVMRCAALAQEWQRRGGKATFFGRIVHKGLVKKLTDNNFNLILLDDTHENVPSLLEEFIKQNRGTNPWCIVDGYLFSSQEKNELRTVFKNLLIVDDLADQKEYSADILLNNNIYASQLNYFGTNAILLLGAKFALLRQEFYREDIITKKIPNYAKRILVTMGGADPANTTLLVLQALKKIRPKDLEIKAVIGPANHYLSLLQQELTLSEKELQCKLLTDVKEMRPLMEWADLAITAAGSTCYELAYLGTPSMTIEIAENQKMVAQELSKKEAVCNCGWHTDISIEQLAERIGKVLVDRDLRERLSININKIVDAKGAFRVVEKMWPSEITFRKIDKSDCETVYHWANEPLTRAASFHQDPIPREVHENWFDSRLKDKYHVFWVAEVGHGESVGIVRFCLEKHQAVISVNVARKFHNLGFGVRIIKLACARMFADYGLAKIVALIRHDNQVSSRCFSKAGFQFFERTTQNGIAAVKMVFEIRK